MRRGTKVGQAYVEITADGSGINEEIVNEVDAAGKDIDKKGDEHGESYGEHFGDSLRVKFSHTASEAGEELNRRLSDAGDDGGKDYGNNFEKSLRKMAKRIGKSIGAELSGTMVDELELRFSRMLQTFETHLKSVSGNGSGGGRIPTSAGNQSPMSPQTLHKWYDFYALFESSRTKLHEDSNKTIEADDRNLLKSQQSIYDSILKMEDQKAAFISKFEAARTKLHEQNNATIFKDDQDLVKRQESLFSKLAKESEKRDADMWKVRRATATAHAKFLSDLDKKRVDEQGNTITRALSKVGNGRDNFDLGALFGAGSRNNALHLFGKALGGIGDLVQNIVKKASAMFSAFTKGFSQAEEGASFLQKAMAGLAEAGIGAGSGAIKTGATAAEGGPVGIIALGAAIVALTLASVVLVSVLNALLAIVVALAATIVSALVAAVAVAGAGFLALGAAVGLTTLAFMSMTDAQQHMLSKAFRPLHQEAIGLGQVMIKQMVPAFAEWSKNLQIALAYAAPLAQVMGGALARAGTLLTQSLSGPGVRQFLDALAVNLPGIVKNLSHAFGRFLNGVLSIFAVILPVVKQFSAYLSDVALTFQRWASSAKGQNAISDFIDRAVTSLKALWNFTKAVGSLIATVFFGAAAQGAGNSIFDSMTNAVRKFTTYLSQDNRMQKWFDTGVQFATALGKIILSIIKIVQSMNSSGVIGAIAQFATGFAALVNYSGQFLQILKLVVGAFGSFASTVGDTAGALLSAVGGLTSAFLSLPGTILSSIPALNALADKAGNILTALHALPGALEAMAGIGTGGGSGGATNGVHGGINGGTSGQGSVGTGGSVQDNAFQNNLDNIIHDLTHAGDVALNNTSTGSGGYNAPGVKAPWKNPYVAFANSLIKDGPKISAQIRNALLTLNKQISAAIRSASTSTDAGSVHSSLVTLAESITTSAKETVNTAQSALNSAAQSLAGATTKSAALKALKDVKQAQADLAKALKNQKNLQGVAKRIKAQGVVTDKNVDKLLKGLTVQNATLADFAKARGILANKIAKANDKLKAAIALRDDFKNAVSDSIKDFGSLLTAQAQTIDGIEQALTHSDITGNLRDRLAQIRKFQADLKILLALGLSNAAYKQIVEAGVETGSQFAEALISGGAGAIGQTNDLVSQINTTADAIGLAASDRMYQAGVSAAQGLVDGLNSLSAQLDSAAVKLGTTIANSLKRALGIKSPSRVLRDMMDYVGDGAVQGLDRQHVKVGNAAARLAGQIAVSPEVAAYASKRGDSATVSGNGDPRFRDLIVNTPTEDPEAVAHEVLNEVVGRL